MVVANLMMLTNLLEGYHQSGGGSVRAPRVSRRRIGEEFVEASSTYSPERSRTPCIEHNGWPTSTKAALVIFEIYIQPLVTCRRKPYCAWARQDFPHIVIDSALAPTFVSYPRSLRGMSFAFERSHAFDDPPSGYSVPRDFPHVADMVFIRASQ